MSALRYVYEVGAFYIAQLHYGLAALRPDRDFAVRRRSGDNAAYLLSALLKRNFRFVPRKAPVILYDEERTLDAGRTDFKEIFQAAKRAVADLAAADDAKVSDMLRTLADETDKRQTVLLDANKADLEKMDKDNPMYDRLRLDGRRLDGIAADMRNVAGLQSPVGRILSETVRPNGMKICKVSVPFGVVGIIYEARPNVSFDVFSLCVKSGNACILKGGSDAFHTNSAIVELIRSVLRDCGFDENLNKGAAIVTNAKTRRVSVCNALDCLIVHKDRLFDLPGLCSGVKDHDVVIYADEAAYAALEGNYPAELLLHADEDSFGTEFLSYRMAVRTVDSLDEALQHISRYSSKHSECIVTENKETADRFLREVDAACVYANVSTAFTDGAQFGFGAEIGISTQKLHARGPMALPELNTYKYVITGDGQIRVK